MRLETRNQLITLLEGEKKLTTTEIAEAINLSRSVTSLYLNELLQEEVIVKVGTKPVYWKSALNTPGINADPFKEYIGSQGSAKDEIDKCKAAVLYPPLGLPLLIHGPSGVGKSFLAQLIYQYLQVNQVNGAEKLIVFNCADYANNPELLSALLFGYKKGAFTGAEKEKKGLLSQANNGVLFLDEIHRLSHENQEKLFQFMDSNKFRPIGEENKMVTSNVRLLFATTEDPEKYLLPTFYRRISVLIELPSFHERPILERIELVKHLFYKESLRINKNIQISNHVFDKLINEELKGNIGSLSNQIQMFCAEALRVEHFDKIVIGEKGEADVFIDHLNQDEFHASQLEANIQEQFLNLLTDQTDLFELQQRLNQFDNDYLEPNFGTELSGVLAQIGTSVQQQNKLIIDKPYLTEEPIKMICRFLLIQAELPPEQLSSLAEQLASQYSRTYLLAKNLTTHLAVELQLFVRVFLGIALIDSVSEDIRYQALLVAHGNTTATSIQAVANKMCGDYIFDGINMPLDSSVRDVVAKVKRWLAERDTTEGVIMLVDMGSLTQLYKSLKPQIQGELLAINNLTTSYALEIGQKLLNGDLFYKIAKSVEKSFVTDVQYFEGFSVEKNVIISSISGQDIAKKVKKICQKYFNQDLKLIDLNYNELVKTMGRAYKEKEYLKETALILTTSYLDNKTEVESFNLLDLLDGDAEKQLARDFKHLIHPNNIPELVNEFIHFFSKEGLSEKLVFLNPDVIIRQVEDIANMCEKRFGLQLQAKLKFNLMMHVALMVERTILGAEDYALPEDQDLTLLKVNGRLFYQNAKNIFHGIEQFYKIEISTWELYVLYEILSA